MRQHTVESPSRVYFDTSSWNDLTKLADREKLIHRIQDRKQLVLASVISVGEVLRISDSELRRLACSTMSALHGDGSLLEHPLNLARAAAQAVLRGEEDFVLPHSGPGNSLRASMADPTDPLSAEIWNWLRNMDHNMERFIQEIKPPQRDGTTRYLSPEVLDREDFLKILCQFPPAKELGVSVPQMRAICGKSDVWKALGATLAYIISLSTTYAPKNRQGKKRTGGRDLWQAPYLGVVEVFVTSDTLMLEAVSKISALLSYPRCTMCTKDFFECLQAK